VKTKNIINKIKKFIMKKNLTLNNLAKNTMKEKEMNIVKGGRQCGCGCRYEGMGGASTNQNAAANYCGCLTSPGEIKVWILSDTPCDDPCVVF
jgi:natural product precursor